MRPLPPEVLDRAAARYASPGRFDFHFAKGKLAGDPLYRGIVETVTDRFGGYSGALYRRPGVRGIVEEGRSFLTRAPGGYNVLLVSLVDSWSATSSGAYSLSENYLYTVEALRLYLSKVAPSKSAYHQIPRLLPGA